MADMLKDDPAGDVSKAGRLMGGAALGIAVGVGVAGSVSPTVGGVVIVGGWLAMLAGIHKYGRAGSE
ncbi:MAG: hypothetical protein U0169_18880 [Polyangiaceae bacterium]